MMKGVVTRCGFLHSVFDKSNSNFTLSASPTITVTSPNGGEIWELGSTHDITWTSTGEIGNVVIKLYRDGSFYLDIVVTPGTENDGSYTWDIPSSWAESSAYKIRIYSNSPYEFLDESDGNFTLSTSPLDLTGTWSLTWDWYCNGADGTTDIEFYSNGTGITSSEVAVEWTAETGTANLTTGLCAAVNFSYNAFFTYTNYGTIYYLMVDGDEAGGPQDGYGDGTNDGEFGMTLGGGGIDCSDYLITALPFSDQNTNVGMGDDWDVTGSDGEDVAYVFNISEETTIDVTLCAANTMYDTKLEIFTFDGTDCSLTYTDAVTTGYYNDDFTCAHSYSGLESSLLNVTLAAGLYYIVVDGYAGYTGYYELSIVESTGRTVAHDTQAGFDLELLKSGLNPDDLFTDFQNLQNARNSSNKSTRLHKSVPWKLNSKNGE